MSDCPEWKKDAIVFLTLLATVIQYLTEAFKSWEVCFGPRRTCRERVVTDLVLITEEVGVGRMILPDKK